ncbi:MAG: gltP [Chitinophagaceae bacterium]|nr:gltP [Chitinophagaceae bacterium]
MGIKKIPLSTQIIAAMAIGVAWAFLQKPFPDLIAFTTDWIKPLGKIFIKLLYLVAVPLVFSSLIVGMGSLKSISELKAIGKHTFLIFLTTLVSATIIGLSLAYLISPGHKIEHLAVDQAAAEKITALQQTESSDTFTGALSNIVPDNMVHALSNNTMMLQVVMIAFLLGIALSKMTGEPKEKILGALEAIQSWFTEVIHLIMALSPIGVFALVASLELNADVLLSLGLYMFTVILGLAIMLFVVYPLCFTTLSKTKYVEFFVKSRAVLLMAFSTSSSNATLPLTLNVVKEKFHVPDNISNFVVSVGATINMDGTALYKCVAVYFIAQSLGVELTLVQMGIIILTSILSTAGAAGIPGAGMITLVIILQTVGLPAEGIILILAPDRLLDMFRTAVNVAGDISTSLCVNGLAQAKKVD